MTDRLRKAAQAALDWIEAQPHPRMLGAFDTAEQLRAALAEQEVEPVRGSCPTCEALARTVMCDQVSYDARPAAYAVHVITDDDGIEEWDDIFTSPDVAREASDAYASTGMGERYEVVPLYTAPPAPDDALAEQEVPEADFWKSVVESGKAHMTPQPVALLHTGAMFGGERDEYEFEVNGHERLERFCDQHPDQKIPLFAHPPRREWQGLTEEEIFNLMRPLCWTDKQANTLLETSMHEYRAIEAALKEKNHE